MITYIDLNKQNKRKLVFNEKGKYIVFFQNISDEIIFEIKREGVDLQIFGVYEGKQKDNFKLNTVQHHLAPNSTSNMLIRGVFDDNSSFTYKGLIRIENEAQNSNAYQKNQNLLLSPDCFVESRPYLEILANEVFCTHGSTTGQLDKDQLIYLYSRGLSNNQAKKLLVQGFLQEVFDKISVYKKIC